jgi:hypothetical protein
MAVPVQSQNSYAPVNAVTNIPPPAKPATSSRMQTPEEYRAMRKAERIRSGQFPDDASIH